MVTHGVYAFLVAGLAAITTAALVPTLIRIARQLNLLSVPTEARHVHTVPMPRIGGLAMFVGFSAALALSFWLPIERFPVEVERILLLFIGAVLVVTVMVCDDMVGVSPGKKLIWQIAAAAIIIVPRLRGEGHGLVIDQFTNPFGGTIHLPLLVAIGFTLFWIVGCMNTVNWLDGLDGLAGSVTLVATAVLFFHTFFRPAGDPQFTISLLPAALGGAVIGFLPFNWHPARIIMGDVGAMFLGFTLAVISIIGGAKIATALLALWLPILDVAWVIVYRLINSQSPAKAGRIHLHHRLLDLGWSQRQIVLLFTGISILLGGASLFIGRPEVKFFALIVAGVVGIGLLALLARIGRRQVETSATEFSRRT
jgi:UDP-N-acetylmuramyl pentapeptide phosphotransferase/UDP-N-acetylglucosamine-1-phosphate transferase